MHQGINQNPTEFFSPFFPAGRKEIVNECAGAAKEAKVQKKKNHEIILKLMRSIYILAKNLIQHSPQTKNELSSKSLMAMNCLKSTLVKGHLMLSTHISASVLIEAIVFG